MVHQEAVPLRNYGIIGDLGTVALVGPGASIDFLCLPRFDSPSVFTALLDREGGGSFSLAPTASSYSEKKLYLPNTAVLLSRFRFSGGIAEVSDFMPVDCGVKHVLVRRAKVVHGQVPMRAQISPRFDYGITNPSYAQVGEGVWWVTDQKQGGMVLQIRSEIPLRVHEGKLVGEKVLHSGQTAAIILEVLPSDYSSRTGAPDFVSESFKKTVSYWRNWLSQARYRGRWRESVHRSALTLKLLTSHEYGSIIAAPTFGIPEVLGGARNWDYRFTWIRDGALTASAFLRLGFQQEAEAFFRWIEARSVESIEGPPLRVMYSVDGSECPPEKELSHLSGYGGSQPVRIGNGAAHQLQLDIYGELLDALWTGERFGVQISPVLWSSVERMLHWLAREWRGKDEGIWEVRGGQQDFLFSRLMCWRAFDCALRLSERGYESKSVDQWRAVRDEIRSDIEQNFWSVRRRAYTQYQGSVAVDASALMMPIVDYVGAADPRWVSTLQAIEQDLIEDSLVYRYRPELAAADGLGGDEGTFCLCSFWYVEAVARGGDLEKARFYFEKMMSYSNLLGLFAEEISPSGEMLGNFPQAFSHLALINAALELDARLDAAGVMV